MADLDETAGLSLAAAAAVIARPMSGVQTFLSRYAPWLSLGLGIGAHFLFKHGIEFAPKALGLLVLAWTLPALIARVLPDPEPGSEEARWRRTVRTSGAPFVIVALYKNVLFFLVPVWFGAAWFPSLNMGAPLFLAAMALATCFSTKFHEHVVAHPVRRVLWSAIILFAALVPATAVLAFTRPRLSLFIAAAISTVVTTVVLRRGEIDLSRRAVVSLLASALPVAAFIVLLAPVLPPVPADCLDYGAGTGIVNREVVGRASTFPHGTRRVYAWFAVRLPTRYNQAVSFQWFHDGDAVGPPTVTHIEGGRSAGYRSAVSKNVPAPGHWRVDMCNEANQLIGRVRFEVLR